MEKSISSDLIRGHIDTIILHTLLSGDKYAQQISDSIEEKSDKNYTINQATLYSSLKRLENLKLIYPYCNESDSGRRRFFKITEKGIETVNNNLSNWTYSRSIINKLMDTPENSVKTQIIEKIVEVPVKVESNFVSAQNNTILEEQKIDPKPANEIVDKSPVNSQEVNFRSILDGLIQAQNSSVVVETEVLEPLEKIQPEIKDEKPKFNDTISKETLSQRKNNVNKIDFGELVIKANQEGYKLRISSKESKVAKGIVPINKVRFFASLSFFLIALLQVLIIVLTKGTFLKPSGLAIAMISIGLAIYPIVSTVKFITNPTKTTREIKPDSILTALIVVFNLLIVTVALNLLFGANLSDTFTLITCLIAPCILYLDVLIYFTLRFLFAKKYRNAKKSK